MTNLTENRCASGKYCPESGHFKDIPMDEAFDSLEAELAHLRHVDDDIRAELRVRINAIRTEMKGMRVNIIMQSITCIILAIGIFILAFGIAAVS